MPMKCPSISIFEMLLIIGFWCGIGKLLYAKWVVRYLGFELFSGRKIMCGFTVYTQLSVDNFSVVYPTSCCLKI